MTKKYALTPEHRAQLRPWADRWIANAMSTKAMDEKDRDAMRAAIKGLYEAAGLAAPPPERIVFVPSPLVGNIAAGFAAAIWWLRRDAATWDATAAATRDATAAATRDATRDATEAATDDATWDATRDATWAATRDATAAATRDATDAATWDATRDATEAAHLAISFDNRNSEFLLKCARKAWRMRDAGNHWSSWPAFLSFFRHVAKLDLDVYAKWQHYEAAAIHGSWRWMHPKFCIVSDRPKTLHIDSTRRPHCADGPSHEWRDGWKLYHWHGMRVPAEWIEQRHSITTQKIMAERNAERRRVLMEIYAHVHGPGRIIADMKARLIAEDVSHGRPRKLYEIGGNRFLHVINGSLEPDGTRREFLLGAEPNAKTPHEAVAASYARPASKYREALRT